MLAKTSLLSAVGLWLLGSFGAAHGINGSSPLKVIIDTDFNTIGDDGQALAMAAQLHATRDIQLLGLTIVAGNQYLEQGVSDSLKAIERLGLENEVGVYAGAESPLLHDYASFQLEQTLFDNATQYVAAYTNPKTQQLIAPPDGFATHTIPQKQHAVDFIIESIHCNPGQITLLAIGPLTNVALAIRKDPSIVPLIKKVVIMGGQIYAAGNAYNGAGETNWWFDPESARVVLRADIVKEIVPLDVTNTVAISNETYDIIANHEPATAITRLFADIERWGYVYDTVALASLIDPSLNLDVRDLFVDVTCDFTMDYGKSVVWTEDPYPRIDVETVSSVLFEVDNSRFFKLYVDLLTRPVPATVNRTEKKIASVKKG